MSRLGHFRFLILHRTSRSFATSVCHRVQKNYKLAVVGGGAGGCSIAAKFAARLGSGNVAVIEPNDTHYYQPMWTLVGSGLKNLAASGKPMEKVLPKKADWIKSKVVEFKPDDSRVITSSGEEINYEYLVIAMGLKLHYDQIKGLPEALETPGVGSNYSIAHVEKTWKAIQDFKEGNALFTFPQPPIKCPGAPLKIMFLTERILNQTNRRSLANIQYFTPLPVIFVVKHYADALWKLCNERNLNVNLTSKLIEVKPDKKEAVFQNVETKEITSMQYNMLHVTPPMSTPDELKKNKQLCDESGYLNVEKSSLQHVTYKNIFGIGDCLNFPISKTAAAVAGQLGLLKRNLSRAMKNQPLEMSYDGYTSCPLVTGPGEGFLAEFDFQAPPQLLETFPFDQSKPRKAHYLMKAHVMPEIYWAMLKGYWEGPRYIRKALHLGLCK